jgi:lactate dehydrogenase-like 2-hydroxyacid dehydrogenase
MSRPRILITRRWPDKAERAMQERFDITLNEADQPLSQAELKEALAAYDAVAPTVTDKIGADLFSGPIKAKILGNFGVGFNHIDIAAARAAGVLVTNTPGVLTDATADIAVTLMLMVARRTGEGERELRAGKWTGWRPTHMLGLDVSNKTLGVVGMGRIGKAMARRCHHGFGMNIVFYDPFPVSDPGVPARQLATVEEVLEVADFVSLHLPGGGPNRNLINEARLKRMKPTAFLINSARGDIVDEPALIAALEKRIIGGAGLDVFAAEPTVPEALRRLENVVLLPHLGSATSETRNAMGMRVVENLVAFFEGRTPPDLVEG